MSTQHHRHHHHHPLSAVIQPEHSQAKNAGEDDRTRLLAYEIHCEKGGGALDNWLEAEKSLAHVQ